MTNTCAISYARTGAFHKAIRYFTSALALRPEIGGLWRSLGGALREAGDLESAVEALYRSVHFQGDYARTHLELGRGLLELKRFEEAAAAFREAVRLDPALANEIKNLPEETPR